LQIFWGWRLRTFRGWKLIEAHNCMKTYSSYRASGADYFESAPAHWLVVPGMLAFTENRRDNRGMKENQVLSLSYGKIVVKAEEKLVGLVPESFETYQIAIPGDIIIRCTDLQNDKTSLRTGLVNDRGIITSAYLCLSVKEGFESRYIYYLLHLLDISKSIYKLGSGLRQNLSFVDFKRLPVLRPPYDEQLLIVNYLDQKSVQIDQAIQIKQRQIELLKERKQILIQHTVTRGLTPGALMRDSGIEWIGEIPAHWSVTRAKYIFHEVDERSSNGQQELLSVSHITGVTPRSEKNVSMFMAEDYTGSKMCRKDDLVFNIMWAWMGALGVSDRTGIVSPSYSIFRQIRSGTLSPQFIEMVLKSTGYVEHYNKVSTGLHSSRLRFYGHMFMAMDIGFPDRAEQDSIVSYLDFESGKLNKAVDLLEQQIAKLKEFKSTLINSVVTGKIKVPGVLEPERQDMEMA